jgi:hypothetical protein
LVELGRGAEVDPSPLKQHRERTTNKESNTVMNALHMIQILPVIAKITGWGSTMRQEITDVTHRCNLVTSFKVDGLFTVRRIEGSGEDYAQDRWIIDANTAAVYFVPEWEGHTLNFKRGMF